MPAINLCLTLHEPYQLRRYTVFDLGENDIYEDDDKNCNRMVQHARACYLPLSALLLKLIRRHEGAFKVSLAVSGTTLDLFDQYVPEALDGLKALADTDCVEFIGETQYHPLAHFYAPDEFARQVKEHSARIKDLFGKKPTTFLNAELIYNNDLSVLLSRLGFKAALSEGVDQILGWRSANYAYAPISAPDMRLFLRNRSLSEDVHRRFSDRSWSEWPLTAEKYADWCAALDGKADILNIFWGARAFGLLNPAETGVFAFLEALPKAMLDRGCTFITPREACRRLPARDTIDVPQAISRDANAADLSAWLGNNTQKDAVHALYDLSNRMAKIKNPEMLRDFGRLQTTDHFLNMSTKWFTQKLAYRPNPFESPYDAYIVYMNVLADFSLRLAAVEKAASESAGKKTTRNASAKKSSAKAQPLKAKTQEAQKSASPAAKSQKPGKAASQEAGKTAAKNQGKTAGARRKSAKKAKDAD
ncbi:MAG: alpha-amylase [Desulfovibrio sp.]|nr:alpha-amylase [Desulfovibrio sp.]